MEEVLQTVKKQHKEKHRRKKELKKLAMIEAASAGTSSKKIDDELDERDQRSSSNVERKSKHRDKEKRPTKKRPLQEKSTVENGKVLPESPIKSGTILQHFPRTPKKEKVEESLTLGMETTLEIDVDADHENGNKVERASEKPSKVTNAFEVMMNARNKTIGSNTPGKDSPSPVADKNTNEVIVKRRLKLQEWAEQKGGAKRKLDEEARAAYVEDQLEQRAKRFKEMLVNGSSPKVKNQKQESAEKAKPKRTGRKPKDEERAVETKKRTSRTRRLSSIDSVDSVELSKQPVDAETEEFLAKLNSPTKKRDSLLGYFQKKESPKEMAERQLTKSQRNQEIPIGTKEMSSRCENTKTPVSNSDCLIQEIGTPSGRPRRSCTGKARYDFDLEESPSKATRNTPARKSGSRSCQQSSAKTKPEEDNCDVVIVLDDSSNLSATMGNITPQGTPKKLAPLFVRSVPKPSPDPEFLKARKAFLLSGVPEKLRIEQEKQKQQEQCYEESIEIFPQISHIKQLTETELAIEKQSFSCTYTIHPEEIYLQLPSPPPTRRGKGKSSKRLSQTGTFSDCTPSDFQINRRIQNSFKIENMLLPTLANKRAIIKNWKTEFERFPTFKCYNQMREKYRYFSAIDSAQDTEQVSDSLVVTRRTRRSMEQQRKNEQDNPDEEYKPPPAAPNGELLFSEKYKPLLFEQVLVNLNPVTQLRDFLSNWSSGSSSSSAKNSQNFDDSMDFNDSSCSNQGASCNTVVLLGPVSSGKTNAVFALANDMNFNVLEINAGMKRTGKKLIQELQEATQSHQIRKDAAGSGSSQKKNLLKKSLNGLKTQMMRQNSNNVDSTGSDSSNSELSQSTRKCLILIEDADIVFDQTDAGFTDAIYTLAASSKRPVIVVASNPNCAHLQRLMAQNTIHFSSPNVLNISKFLAVLSLIENCPVLLDDIISLYLYNNRDLRKTLLELQFFIQSGGDRHKQLNKAGDQNKSAESKDNNSSYFASPRKRQFSVEQEQTDSQENTLQVGTKIPTKDKSTNKGVYMHRSLFEFFTVCQNSKFRVPFPVDFRTFSINLNDIFGVSRKLLESSESKQPEVLSKSTTTSKRKSKSPKKQWIKNHTSSPLDNLCFFYENLSVASMLDNETEQHSMSSVMDRLNPNLSESISHNLLERAIDINLEADVCPYNLFDTPKTIISLCNEMGSTQLRSKRVRNLDYEPTLRNICRSEKVRSTLERRSTRFYHYLRTYAVNVCNFSTANFDQACDVFQAASEVEIEQASGTT
ncbi:enhanced level of genomic instability 1 [Musca vetustissima]|uniref:enhanced level of genomic instability 1 n=1 Tax=Musca vetustissima TaxID=27455 RepID=UPI002AB6A0C5|nr:enhanced level of genomic instability 1 [Musca vetustissima]